MKLKIENVMGIRLQSGKLFTQNDGESEDDFIERIRERMISGQIYEKVEKLVEDDSVAMKIVRHRKGLLEILDEKNYDVN